MIVLPVVSPTVVGALLFREFVPETTFPEQVTATPKTVAKVPLFFPEFAVGFMTLAFPPLVQSAAMA